ncbi:hypothetical protein [Clostridium estertheticum]|nr:hypothetical protein [Clostridium estertheticum]MCB2347330.1 hypothetical protein [Clostridium estertheticum]
MKVIICLIALTLIMIAEKGVPVKLTKWDYLIYLITYFVFLQITDSL